MKAKVGNKVWSQYFDAWLIIVEIDEDRSWWFRDPQDRHITKARTPLSWFEQRGLVKQETYT